MGDSLREVEGREMHSSPGQENWAGFDGVGEQNVGEEPVQRPEWTAKELRMRDCVMRGKAMTPVVRHNILNIGLSACALLLPPIAALAAVFTIHPVQDNYAPHEEQASRREPYYFSIATYREQSIDKNLPRASNPVQSAPDIADKRGSAPDSSRATLQSMVLLTRPPSRGCGFTEGPLPAFKLFSLPLPWRIPATPRTK
jgi:hypothetical protein